MDIQIDKKIPFKENLSKIHKNWEYWLNSYKVDDGYTDILTPKGNKLINKFTCENKSDYTERVKRTTPRNYIGNIINSYTNIVFRNPPERDEQFNELYNNVDGRGKPISKLLKAALQDTLIFGFSPLLIETQVSGGKLSIAQSKNLGLDERIIKIDPFAIANWTIVDDYLTEIIIRFVDDEANPFYRYYTSDFVQDIEVDKNDRVKAISEPVEHGFDDIPVVLMQIEVAYDSFVQPLSNAQRSITNYLSLVDTELYEQTFTRWSIPLSEDVSQDDLLAIKDSIQKEWGSSRILFTVGTGSPTRMTADASQADSIRSQIKETEQQLFELSGVADQDVGMASSGESRRLSREKFYVIASDMADAVQATENKLLELIANRRGTNVESTYYDKDFEVIEWSEKILELRDILSLDLDEETKEKAKDNFKSLYFLDK